MTLRLTAAASLLAILSACGSTEAPRADAAALGYEAYRAGDLERAEALYGEALAADPSDARALLGLGEVLERTGRAGQAQDYFARAGAANSGAIRTWRAQTAYGDGYVYQEGVQEVAARRLGAARHAAPRVAAVAPLAASPVYEMPSAAVAFEPATPMVYEAAPMEAQAPLPVAVQAAPIQAAPMRAAPVAYAPAPMAVEETVYYADPEATIPITGTVFEAPPVAFAPISIPEDPAPMMIGTEVLTPMTVEAGPRDIEPLLAPVTLERIATTSMPASVPERVEVAAPVRAAPAPAPATAVSLVPRKKPASTRVTYAPATTPLPRGIPGPESLPSGYEIVGGMVVYTGDDPSLAPLAQPAVTDAAPLTQPSVLGDYVTEDGLEMIDLNAQ